MSTVLTDGEARDVRIRRHEAQCSICQHPQRQLIEEMWLDWCYTHGIAENFGVSRYGIYRHAHALGLFSIRRQNGIRVLEKLMERGDVTEINGSVVVSAYKLFRELVRAEERVGPVQGPDLKMLFERLSKEEREAYARDGSLPEWFTRALAATPTDSQQGEKESQVPESTRVQ